MKSELVSAFDEMRKERDGCRFALTEKDTEIEQLRAEIERLRYQLAAIERGYKSFRDTAEVEFTRLRGLLRECDAALDWQGHNGSCLDQSRRYYNPDCPECRLLTRVREALGDGNG